MKKLLTLLIILALALPLARAEGERSLACVGCSVVGADTFIHFIGSQEITIVADRRDAEIEWKVSHGAEIVTATDNTLVIRTDGQYNVIVEALYDGQTPQTVDATAYTAASALNVDGKCVITTVGCKLRYHDKAGQGAGEKQESIDFTESYTNPVTGENCEGGLLNFEVVADHTSSSQIDYWVIDGVKYLFYGITVKSIDVIGANRSMSFEVVYKHGTPQTLLTEEQIQSRRTGGSLKVRVEQGRLHVMDGAKTIGDATTEFDFTRDYTLDNGKTYKGGSCYLAVYHRSTHKDADFWWFDDIEMHFSHAVDRMYISGLYYSITYKPHLMSLEAGT